MSGEIESRPVALFSPSPPGIGGRGQGEGVPPQRVRSMRSSEAELGHFVLLGPLTLPSPPAGGGEGKILRGRAVIQLNRIAL